MLNHLQKYNNTTNDITLDKISKVIEYTKKYCDLNNEKYNDALYAFRWLFNNFSYTQEHKMKKPTKKQRTNAIEVITEFIEQTNPNKKETKNIKIYAEYVKAKIQQEIGF